MELVRLIKQAGLEAQRNSQPVEITTGRVISTSPLKIQLNPKLILGSDFLILSRNVTDYEVEMTVNHKTEDYELEIDTRHNHGTSSFDSQTSHKHVDSVGGETEESTISTAHSHNDSDSAFDLSHSHEYKGKKLFKVHNALRVGERVVLVSEQGGQRYYVIDRLEVIK